MFLFFKRLRQKHASKKHDIYDLENPTFPCSLDLLQVARFSLGTKKNAKTISKQARKICLCSGRCDAILIHVRGACARAP